ncbi:sialidase family protein [Paenibacillus oryzisoli]|uniref:LamG-like jellyroll fold domain-containing protein n=1 Tax=Paenibacillus oryzisoli TaxID=1850517 RepID=UPI003D2B1A8C
MWQQKLKASMRNITKLLTITGAAALILAGSLVAPGQPAQAAEAPFYNETVLFESTVDGYAQYRIPGVVVTGNGTVITYAEARKTTSDWADIDIYMRRSTDGGATWEPRVKLVDGVTTANTINNPVMIAEKNSGTVHFLYCKEYNQAFYRKSTDNGATWSAPVEITSVFNQFKTEFNWAAFATGPGHGIQLNNGRLLVPVWLTLNTSHAPGVVSTIYSDDGGATWNRGEILWDTPDIPSPNETTSVQLTNGSVMLNMRNSTTVSPSRSSAVSLNGSSEWTTPKLEPSLPDPNDYGSIVRFTDQSGFYSNRLLFSNTNNPGDRSNLTVKMSMDEGSSWTYSKVLAATGAAYSDLAVSNDKKTIYCYYEKWNGTLKYHYLVLARFNLEWLTDGEQSLDPLSGPAPSFPAIPTVNMDEPWNNASAWSVSGGATISPAGQLSLSSNTGTISSVNRTDLSIPQTYTLEFKAKIDDFTNGAIGVSPYPASLATKIGDGKYRLMLDFRTDGIYVIDNYGEWRQLKAVALNSSWHVWKVAAQHGVAEVYMDGVSQGRFAMQSGNYGDVVQHWVLGTSSDAASAHLEYSKLYTEPPVAAETSAVNLDESWKNVSAWTIAGSAAVSPAGQLNLSSNTGTISSVSRTDLAIPQAYTLEFRAKIDDFSNETIGVSPFPASLATKVGDGQYRLMLDFRPNGIYAMTSYDVWTQIKAVTLDSAWHQWKVRVTSGTAEVYMDGVYQAAFAMQAGSYSDVLQHWVLGSSADAVNAHIESTRLYTNLPSSAPVGYWKFNETSGTAASDSSGNGHAGTVYNGAVWAAGKAGGGLNFDGTNDYVDVGNKVSLQFGKGDFTAAAWVKTDTVSGNRFIFWYGDVGTDVPSWWVQMQAGKLAFQVDGTSAPTGNFVSTDTAVLPLGVWTHIAVTREASIIRIYVNGVETKGIYTSSIPDVTSASNGLVIGKDKNGTTRYWDGMIDEVRVYDRSLSSTEVQALWGQ